MHGDRRHLLTQLSVQVYGVLFTSVSPRCACPLAELPGNSASLLGCLFCFASKP